MFKPRIYFPKFHNKRSYSETWSVSKTTILYLDSSSKASSSSSPSSSQQEPPPLPDTKDPFVLLGLSTPTADKIQIKRAYKRMALRYHPDVRINASSTPEEKKQANDDFARINDAYNRLTARDTTTYSTTNRDSTSSSSTYNAPPHRKPASTTTNTTTSKYTWEDYVWNKKSNEEEDEDYNTQGDSFQAIFTDLFTSFADGAAGVVAEGVRRGKKQNSGVLHDLIEFLEQSGSNYFPNDTSSSSSSWKDILEPQTIQDVSLEMEDTSLLITQLERKLQDLEKESQKLQVDLLQDKNIRFVEKMDIQEQLDEVLARKKIVLGYLNKSNDRYSILQQRYKELTLQARKERSGTAFQTGGDSYRRVFEEDDVKAKATTTTSYQSRPKSSMGTVNSSYSPSMEPTTSSQQNQSTGSDKANSSSSSSSTSTWKRESFGRRSSRVSSRPQGRDGGSSSYTENDAATTRVADTNYKIPSSQQQSSNSKNVMKNTVVDTSILPPHRRMTSNSTTSFGNTNNRSTAFDKKRLRDLKVDEDFEKLKREMGL